MNENEMIVEDYNEATELAVAPEAAAPVTAGEDYVCTMKIETQEQALDLFEALSNADALDDHIGEVIHVHDYVVQNVQMVDAETGELTARHRIVLMCDEGNFGTVSTGVETAMRNLTVALAKFPAPWNPPIALKPVKQQGNKGYKFTSLERVR